ncbi:MAG: erythromycin esterase family protein [Planctomycetes bacterium]|nr:erythromycin esterase family protein [Planctomycetota bacterium]
MHTLQRIVIGLLAVSAACANDRRAAHDSTVPEVAPQGWLCANSTTASDLEPEQLSALLQDIGEAKIVVLGETHEDGAAYRVKAALVRELHQKLGFRVIAWEMPFFDGVQAERSLESDLPGREVMSRVGDLWSHSAEVEELISYVSATRHTSNPLRLFGFDCKFGLVAQDLKNELLNELIKFFYVDGVWLAPREALLVVAQWLRSGAGTSLNEKLNIEPMPSVLLESTFDTPVSSLNVADAVDELLFALSSQRTEIETRHGHLQGKLVERMLLLVRMSVQWLETAENATASTERGVLRRSIRERAMAETILWYMNEVYHGEKIIVWTAGIHGLKESPLEPQGSMQSSSFTPMTGLLRSQLGSAVYAIGFTASGGEVGNADSTQVAPVPMPPAAQGSLERWFLNQKISSAVIMMRRLPRDHWLKSPTIASIYEGAPIRTYWWKLIDSVVFYPAHMPWTPIR